MVATIGDRIETHVALNRKLAFATTRRRAVFGVWPVER